MKRLIALLFVVLVVTLHAAFPHAYWGGWRSITRTPPVIWVDVQSFTNLSDLTETPIITNLGTAGGWFLSTNWSGGAGSDPHFAFRSILGGVMTALSNNVSGMSWVITNNQQYWSPTAGTMAMYLRFPGSPGAVQQVMQTGFSPPTVNFGALTFTATEIFYDHPQVNGNGRMHKVIPPGTTGQWFTVILTRDGLNQDIWINGTNYCHSNNVTGKVTNNFSGRLALAEWNFDTNYLWKRILLFPYGLNTNEVAAFHTWMTNQTPVP